MYKFYLCKLNAELKKKVFCHSETGFTTSVNIPAEFEVSRSGEFNYFCRCEEYKRS
jgi:hypothetical protein